MNKELFVTSTPHETKVGLVEDDQLAEIYLEREGEYTLAGSIYKGRVTRVLPGMQSAFVDIGLERDAFLYVSDFFELEDQGDGEEVIPVRPVASGAITESSPDGGEETADYPEVETSANAGEEAPSLQTPSTQPREASFSGGAGRDRDRGFRGRGRGRRGRGGFGDRNERGERSDRGGERSDRGNERNDRGGERKFSRGPEAPPEPVRDSGRTSSREATSDSYGPPPGYQPIVLPGESISKYRGRVPAAPEAYTPSSAPAREDVPVAAAFPDDEPMFASGREVPTPTARAEVAAEPVLSAPVPDRHPHIEEVRPAASTEFVYHPAPEPVRKPATPARPQEAPAPLSFYSGDSTRAVEEEEIEEEEAELAAYAEDATEEDAFEEMVEEIHGPNGVIASEEVGNGAITETTEEAPMDAAALAEEFQMQQQQEAELEAIQEEAEKLAEAVERGEPVEGRAEVRAPAATAAFLQRAQRAPQFDRRPRRGGERGERSERGGGRGRRFGRREAQAPQQIAELLKEGQEVLIQIAKEPIGKKGARITSHIALPGRFLVFMPTVNHIGVSRKISSDEERQRLKRIMISERENGQGGFIVRTAAGGAAEDELRADIRFLKSLWAEIKNRSETSRAPALIYHDLNVVERVLRDQVTSDFTQIWVDTETEYERILRFAQRFQPALVKRIKLYTKNQPLFEQFGLQEEMNKALKSKVWLKSGGYIVINQTEALVAIDVNTGKYVGKTSRLEDTIVKTNVDAIKEIVRQVRLRDLGGIIVIDFIDMDERRNRQKVMMALEEELRNDRAPSKVLAFNDFGLVAITRKRVKQSLERTIGTPCPYCTATGFVKSPTTVCNEIYIEMRKMAKELNHADVMLRVNPEVAKVLKAENGRWLQELEELTKHTIIVKSDASLHQEQFDIN
jgi:Rne/Rng family ribonuclease